MTNKERLNRITEGIIGAAIEVKVLKEIGGEKKKNDRTN